MANTYTHLQYHCVWSTKNRKPVIIPEIEKQVWAMVAETAKTHGMFVKKAGGIEDHVHVLIQIPKTLSVSEGMKRLKGGSSNAIQQSGLLEQEFAWQVGYAAFTVSKSVEPEVVRYISNQREHHRTKPFDVEIFAMLKKHDVDFDPKYVLD